MLLDYVLGRFRSRLEHALERLPIDLDFMEFICSQELVFLNSISEQINIAPDVLTGLSELVQLIRQQLTEREPPTVVLQHSQGALGRPRLIVSAEHITNLMDMEMPVKTIASLLGVSRRTVYRRMTECNLSVRGRYSRLTDDELDAFVRRLKERAPYWGYRMVRSALETQGCRVQYDRVRASMHRVDTVGVISRLTQLGCVIRRSYSVSGPRSLMHIDTNHKLIR